MKHLKSITTLALSAAILASVPQGIAAVGTYQNQAPAVTAASRAKYGAPVSVSLNGAAILSEEAGIIGATTYVPLRKFCDALGASGIQWSGATNTATVTAGSLTLRATTGQVYIEANGRYFYTVDPILNLDGSLWVPIRPLAKAFCLDLVWHGDTRTVALTRTDRVLVSGADFYKSDDVYWLSRIIHAEAGGEPFLGKMAVGNVVLNRVRSSQYPNTIWGVIFDRKHGTQFSPVSFGTIYNTPSSASVIAAKLCLEGYSLSTKALFFMNPRIATSTWISNNRPYLFTIGKHDFYS